MFLKIVSENAQGGCYFGLETFRLIHYVSVQVSIFFYSNRNYGDVLVWLTKLWLQQTAKIHIFLYFTIACELKC